MNMKKQLYPIITERHFLHQQISLAMCLLLLVVGCRKADDDMVGIDEHGAVTIL
ncbi:hypothetical protein DI53_0404 [Sphingobacterium deserti]|uniref:Uncharacterized protein n=1 Tax=Sphingobacterium deserti TaxID=1229276 RepID=A0A0B8T3R0_9SPHI|nr:hypothetical protein DI53_0404 [Sphingobacterium deserti]